METGINVNAFRSYDSQPERELGLIAGNGFTHVFADAENGKLGELTALLPTFGLVCDTLHAPFDDVNNMWSDGEDGDRTLGRYEKCVLNCEEYGVPVMIQHLSSGDSCPQVNERGLERFGKLVAFAEEHGVKIAFENQRKLGNIACAMEYFPGAGFCWDTGHEACFAYGREYMPLFGDRLIALHIHDNYAEHNGDKHMIPFDASLDFGKIARHIASSGYCGTVMLEVFSGASGFYADYTEEEYYRRAGLAARKLGGMIEKIRTAQP